MNEVLILGAGPAGLAAGLTLARAGRPVTVIDKSSAVGGVSRTVSWEGGRFDLGGHRWFTKNEQVDAFVHDLLGDEFIICPRSSHIYFNGQTVRYPLSLLNVLTRMGAGKSVSALLGFLWTRARRRLHPRAIVSMRDAYIDQFGPVLYETFFQQYSEKLWGLDCDQLSGDWVLQRSKGMSVWHTLLAMFKKTEVTSLIEQYQYPRLGIGRIAERMAEEIEKLGGTILLNHQVTGFGISGSQLDKVVLQSSKGQQHLKAPAVLCSLPLPQVAQWLNQSGESSIRDASSALRFRGLIFVTLLLDQPRVTRDSWMYLQDERLIMTRVHEPNNWSRDLVPEGKSVLVFEIASAPGDARWKLPDEAITELVIEDLVHKLKFVKREQIIAFRVTREAEAYPVYEIGYKAEIARLQKFLARFSNLTMIGRNGMFRYNNMDHSIETGIKAAQNILGAAHDLGQINSSTDYQEIK